MKKQMMHAFGIVMLITSACAGDNGSGRIPAKGFAVHSERGRFQPHAFTRHAVGDNDIQIEILYAGICHSDLHAVANDLGHSEYPFVPGHEIAGRVVKIGKGVTAFKVGDFAGIGCMVNACGQCSPCGMDKQQFCERGTVFTYGSHDTYHGHELTMGGYSDNYVVSEKFAIKIPAGADLKRVAPLLCAGITTYSAIRYSRVKKGDAVGVAGFGGLGHMAVQYLVENGADVTVFDVAEDKRHHALRLGAKRYVNVNKPDELNGLKKQFDFIITTIPADYDPLLYIRMLKMETGELAIVGLPKTAGINISALVLAGAHRKIYGSLIGGIKETQEMLDYSVKHKLYPEVEVITADGAVIDRAYQDIQNGKAKFRYVIDMKTMK